MHHHSLLRFGMIHSYTVTKPDSETIDQLP